MDNVVAGSRLNETLSGKPVFWTSTAGWETPIYSTGNFKMT